jgi:hypothetical protein
VCFTQTFVVSLMLRDSRVKQPPGVPACLAGSELG